MSWAALSLPMPLSSITQYKKFFAGYFISSLRLFSLNCRPCHIAFSTNGCKMSVGILISSGTDCRRLRFCIQNFFSTLQIQVAGKVRAFAILYRVLCFLLRHKSKTILKSFESFARYLLALSTSPSNMHSCIELMQLKIKCRFI